VVSAKAFEGCRNHTCDDTLVNRIRPADLRWEERVGRRRFYILLRLAYGDGRDSMSLGSFLGERSRHSGKDLAAGCQLDGLANDVLV
jgi:hypothetical protein